MCVCAGVCVCVHVHFFRYTCRHRLRDRCIEYAHARICITHMIYIFLQIDIYICVCVRVRICLSWMSFACLGTPETVPPEIVAITEPAWYICIHHLPRTARYCKVLSWAKMFVTHQSWFVDIGTSVRDACTLTNV